MLPSFTYLRPATLDETLSLLKGEEVYLHAGGTDLQGCMHDGVFSAKKVVSLSNIDELNGITQTADGGLRLGATTKVAQVAGHEGINERFTVLAEAAQSVASPQLRNQGTIGGNLCQRPRCWYYRGGFECARRGAETCSAAGGQNQYHCIFGGETCYIVHPSDIAPALVALGAKVELVRQGGKRIIPVEEFFCLPSQNILRENVLEPGEMIQSIVVPAPPSGMRSTYRKLRARQTWDFALASAAISIAMTEKTVQVANIVLGGAAPVPWRAREAEQLLLGQEINEQTAAKAGEAAVKNAEPLEYNGYKVPLIEGLVLEVLLGLAQSDKN